jgi:hypothetical protein
MKRAQAPQNAPPNPAREPSFGRISGRREPDTRTGEHLCEFAVETIRKAVEQGCAACYDHVCEEVRANVDVNSAEGGLDKGRDCLTLGWSWVFGILNGGG